MSEEIEAGYFRFNLAIKLTGMTEQVILCVTSSVQGCVCNTCFQQHWEMCRWESSLRFSQGSCLLSFFKPKVLWNTDCVCVCNREGRELSLSFFYAFFLPAFLCVASVYLCVWEGVWAFSWHRSDSPLHLPPSLPSSPSPSFLLNLAFHPVQTVCRCCPPLPLHHACRNEIKP